MRVVGFVLVVLGIVAWATGGFWYSRHETVAEVGPIKVAVEERERVDIPMWVGIASIVGGAVAMTVGGKRSV